jgi:hypothetical protein
MATESGVVEVVGKSIGDCECWCLEVSEDEYRRVVGEELHRIETEYRAGVAGDEMFAVSVWRLYPADLLGRAGIDTIGSPKIRLRITAELVAD